MTAPAAPAEKSSLVEDLVDTFVAPSAMFARRSSGGAWGPFLIVAVLMAVLYFANVGAMQGVFDAEVDRAVASAMERNASMDANAINAMRGITEMAVKWGGVAIMPIILLCLGLVVWLVGRAFGATVTFGLGVMIASFSYLPRTIEFLLVSVQALFLDTAAWTGRYQFSLGVGRFLDPSMKQGLYNLIGRVDVFTLWVTVLLVLGLMHAGKMPKDKAVPAGIALWALGAIPALWQVATGA